MSYTTIEIEYSGQASFVLPFSLGIIDRSHVTVQVNNELDGLGDILLTPFEWISDTEIIIPGLSNGDIVRISRTVSHADLEIDFVEGADITRSNLNRQSKQSIMLIQQILDGRFNTSFSAVDNANRAEVARGDIEQLLLDAESITSDARDALNAALALSTRARTKDNAEELSKLPSGSIVEMGGLSYIVVPFIVGSLSATSDLGVDGLLPYGFYTFEHFGAIGNGVVDDSPAMQRCCDTAKVRGQHIRGIPSSRYAMENSVYVGREDAQIGIRSFIGNGATVINTGVVNRAMFDCVGIQNGLRAEISEWRIEAGVGLSQTPPIATCAFLIARPDQQLSSTVVSSGNTVFYRNTIFGHFSIACIYNVQSESNHLTDNIFFNYNSTGSAVSMVRHDYFEDTTVLETTATETDVWTGTITSSSGATCKVIQPMSPFGRVRVQVLSGIFSRLDVLTSGSGATASLLNEPVVIGAASPNTLLGVEEDSTSSLQPITMNFFNTVHPENNDAALFISDWVDVEMADSNNMNQSNTEALYGQVHVQQDRTRNISKGTGVQFRESGTYHHATHRVSITFGDPISGGGSYRLNISDLLWSGTRIIVEWRIQYIGKGATGNAFDCRLEGDFGIDLSGCQFNGGNTFWVNNSGGSVKSEFKTTSLIEGTLYTNSQTKLTLPSNAANRLSVDYLDRGLKASPRILNYSMVDSDVLLSQSFMSIQSSVSRDWTTVSFINSTIPNGTVFNVRGAQVGVVSIKSGGDFILPAGVSEIKLTNSMFVQLIYDAALNKMFVIGNVGQSSAATGFSPFSGGALRDVESINVLNASTSDLARHISALTTALISKGILN